MSKKAFSFVEIIIVVSILSILAVITTTVNNSMKNKSYNSKIISDLSVIENALVSFTNEGNKLPLPKGNNNYFNIDGSYAHDFTNSEAYGVYGKFTQDNLAKRYLDSIPLDPRTNQYYSYGKTKDSQEFEIAGVLYSDNSNKAKVNGNFKAEDGIYNLIKEYNGANFVIDLGPNLPYNPYEKLLIATTEDGTIYKQGDTITNSSSTENLEIFFSDGSTSIIDPGTTIVLSQMDFPQDTNLVSNIKLFLQAGSIWTNATRLDPDSSFDVYTTDVTASVRGTIFGIKKETTQTLVSLKVGELELKKINDQGIEEEFTQTINGKFKESIFTKNDNNLEIYTLTIKDGYISNSGEIDNVDFSKPDKKGAPKIEKIEDKQFLSEVEEETENSFCYLDGEKVENGKEKEAYKQKYVLPGENCSTPETRECENGILKGDTRYMYRSCTQRNEEQCGEYNKDGFYNDYPLNKGVSKILTKTEKIHLNGFEVGTTTSSKEITCNNDGRSFAETDFDPQINCNTDFEPDGESCKCKEGDFWGGSCYENPFGEGYELVYYDSFNNINELKINDITLPGGGNLNLGNNFAFVFDIEEISIDYGGYYQIPYIKYEGNSILYTESKQLKLWNNGTINYSDGNKNLINGNKYEVKIKFDGNNWNTELYNYKDKTKITLLKNQYKPIGKTIFLYGTNIKLYNSESIKIYKGEPVKITGTGCQDCPEGEYSEKTKNAGLSGERNCTKIEGNTLCEKKSGIGFKWKEKEWSGYLKDKKKKLF